MVLKQPFLCILHQSISAHCCYLTLAKMGPCAPGGSVFCEEVCVNVCVYPCVHIYLHSLVVMYAHLLMHTHTFLSSAINNSRFIDCRVDFSSSTLQTHTHSHTQLASKLDITRALKQNRNMAKSILPRL